MGFYIYGVRDPWFSHFPQAPLMNTTTALEIKPSKQVIFVDMSDPFHATVIFMITEALSKQTIKKHKQ